MILCKGGAGLAFSENFDAQVAEIEVVLRRMSSILRKRGRDILRNSNVTPPQLNALQFLRHDSLTMGELGAKMYLACSTATDLIDRMERNGLILRERDQDDRRVVRLKVTPFGHDVIEKMIDARKLYLAGVLEKVPPEDRQSLIRNLEQIDEIMRSEQPL